jgi:hypothetical protein
VEDSDFLVPVRAPVLSAGVFSASGVRSSTEVFLFALSGFFCSGARLPSAISSSVPAQTTGFPRGEEFRVF